MGVTMFIAVQCIQCSTMQVKQQKKSSNKWTCVVCNQKQSQRHVFAQGSMAKDVRKFVQTFNMSRGQFSDLNRKLFDEEERVETLSPLSINESKDNKKRSDWSEYVDYDDENEKDEYRVDKSADDGQGDNGVVEPMVVTEMPNKAAAMLFKKPKLNKDYYYSSSGRDEEDNKLLIKPVFRNRTTTSNAFNAKRPTLKDDDQSRQAPKRGIAASDEMMGLNSLDLDSNWNSFRASIHDNNNNKLATTRKESHFVQKPMERVELISKWTDYITKDKENYKSEKHKMTAVVVDKQVLNSKWTDYITEDEESYKNEKHKMTEVVDKPVLTSKWSSFITEEEEDYDLKNRGRKESRDGFISQRRNDAFESLVNNDDERVEDDVHPDFL